MSLRTILTLAAAVILTVCTNVGAVNAAEVLNYNKRTIVIEETIPEVMELDAVDRRNVLCMSVAMLFEGENKNPQDLRAVGHVIMNRTKKRLGGDTPCEIVFSSAFTFVKAGAKRRVSADNPSWEQIQKLALAIYENPNRKNPIGKRTHYYNPGLLREWKLPTPGWVADGTNKLPIGKHIYMELAENP